MNMNDKRDIFGLPDSDLIEFLKSIGEKQSYRAKQIVEWIYKNFVTDFSEMSNLPGRIRDKLEQYSFIGVPDNVEVMKGEGNSAVRFLFTASDGAIYESVLIPEAGEEGRNTACVSSQAGCKLGCKFCATGKLGFTRDLSRSEIIGQVWYMAQFTGQTLPITNVVFMGMGEPLLNLDNVISVIRILKSDLAYGIGSRRITVSTAGIVPGMKKLIAQDERVRLAVSLNAPTDFLRSKLMPIAKEYTIGEILQASQDFYEFSGRWVTMEYVMLASVNDSEKHAEQLAKTLRKWDVKVNLIPYNECESLNFKRPSPDKIQRFLAILLASGVTATVRNSQGADINAACGQLAASKISDPE